MRGGGAAHGTNPDGKERGFMACRVLVLTDLEGALISSRRPEVDGRRYTVVARGKWDKKVITYENMEKMKELRKIADIVPVTKLSAKQCCAVAFCVDIPMSLVESGAMLMRGVKPDYGWRIETLKTTFGDADLYHAGKQFLRGRGYVENGPNEFTLDYVTDVQKDIDRDVDELNAVMGGRYRAYKAGPGRIYAYHAGLGRRNMVRRFIGMFPYDRVISICARNTGWLQETGTSISVEGAGADYEYPQDLYDTDIHGFATFALDKAVELAGGCRQG